MKVAKLVSFDLDGTITDMSFANSVWLEEMPRRYAVKKGMSLEIAKRKVADEYSKVGKKRLEWYDLNYWIRKFCLGVTPKEIIGSFQDQIRIFPEVNHVLEKIQDEGFRMILLTNARREFADVELETTQIPRYFEHVFSVTSDFGLIKSTVAPYLKMCDICNVSPREVVHVGDDEFFDVEVPKEIGITAFHIDRASRSREENVLHSLTELIDKIL